MNERLKRAENEKKPRRQRRDTGARLLTRRDKRVLSWIAQQYAVRFDHVQQLLSQEPGHTSDRFAPGPAGVSDSDVLQVITRWEQEPAWAGYRRFSVETPGWVWVTPLGLEMLHGQGLVPKYGRHTLRESTFEHLHALNSVRLDYERRHPQYRWVSERTLRKLLGQREQGDDLAHLPDAQLWLDDHRAVAVEVELSPKSDEDYDQILDELVVSGVLLPDGTTFVYRTVWYFVSSANDVHAQAWRLVEAARARLPEPYSRRVQIIDLGKVVSYDASAAPTTSGEHNASSSFSE